MVPYANEIYGDNACETDCSCDLCGLHTSGEKYATPDGLSLCLICFQKMEDLENGSIKDSILKFTMGNVF